MSGAAKKSSKTKSKTVKQMNCCECLNPSDKSVSIYPIALCTSITKEDHINDSLEILKAQLKKNLPFIKGVLKHHNVWIDNNIFDWTDANGQSPLLNIIHRLLYNHHLIDHNNDEFLKIMSRAIFTDQDHDFLDGDARTKFDKKKCTEITNDIEITGLRGCLQRPDNKKLTIEEIKEDKHFNDLNRAVNPDPHKKLEGIEYMINDIMPSKLLDVVEDIKEKEIYTIASYIDSAPCSSTKDSTPCSSTNIPSTKKCPYYNISNNIEFIITNLAFAFYQSFFKELNEFSLYIECNDYCKNEYNKLFNGDKKFTIIIRYDSKSITHRFEGIGGSQGDFTVPRIIRTLAVCNVLCPKIVILIDWLRKSCNIKDDNKIKRIVINLNILMKGFGDFCQMFMCLFFYFVKIQTGVDAAGNTQICVFNKNIILTTCDSYLALIALICNCPHIIGHCTEENHRWIFIDSNSIYLGKTLSRCWNDFYNIQLVVDNNNGTDRKVRHLTTLTTFNESYFCFEYGDKAIDKNTFLNNLIKNIISYKKQLVLFEKEFAILHHQTENSKTFVLHLTPEDIRLNTLTAINNIYTNPLHTLGTDKKITFAFENNYKLSTIYNADNISYLKPLITTLYEFIELVLTIHATCKFYEQVFTTSITKIVYTNKKQTQVQLLNDSSIVNKINVSKIKTELKTTDDIIQGELDSLASINPSFQPSKLADIPDIDFVKFENTLKIMQQNSKIYNENTFLAGEKGKNKAVKGSLSDPLPLLDPLIVWAKLKQFNQENSDDPHIIAFKQYFNNPKFGTGNNSIQSLIKTFKILDLTASTIIMYKELLSNMKTLKQRITEIKSKIDYSIIDGKYILDNDIQKLDEYIDDLETKILRLKGIYTKLYNDGYIPIIDRANEQFRLIIEYLHDDNNLDNLNRIKGYLASFVGDSKKAGILEKLVASVFKTIYSNIAIITTDCGGECGEVCVSNGAPGGPQSVLPEATATGAQEGGNKKQSMQLKNSKGTFKGTFKGGFILSESSQELYNLCENYKLEKSYNILSISNELSLLYSSEFTNILVSNDMLATIQMTSTTSTAITVKRTKSSNSANSAINMMFKNYINKLFYNYFTYILIWTFTRHMETNLAKFKHFVECYRLLIIEKNRLVGNIVNQFAYYLSKNPETEADAEFLLNIFNLYEGSDLTILDEYYKMIELQSQRILDFPHIFNEFIKENLDLRPALAQHDLLLSQQSSSQTIEAILFNIVPFYIDLFTTNFQMIYHFVSGYVIQFHQPSQNPNNMPQNIESNLVPIIDSINSKISAYKIKIKKLRNDIGNIDTKIRSIPLRNQRQKERGQGNQDDDRRRDRVLERKRYLKSSNYLKKLKSTKTAKSTELDILVAELKNLHEDLEDVQKLYTLSSKMSPTLVKYSELNAYINELYWRPDELPAIEKFQELHIITIITPPIYIGICQYFNDIITELTKQKKKNALLTTISKIDTKISGLKKTMSRPKNTQREKDTEKERGRERGKKSSRDSRRRRRSRSRRSRESGKKDTKTAIEGSVDDIKVELKKLKDLKETKIDELARMNGGVSAIKSGNKPKTINTSDKVALTKYKLRVEQYKNKEFTTYFEKKLRVYINDSSINIYTIGIRKMKDILKNIYNITK
jgi:hypothetical protein